MTREALSRHAGARVDKVSAASTLDTYIEEHDAAATRRLQTEMAEVKSEVAALRAELKASVGQIMAGQQRGVVSTACALLLLFSGHSDAIYMSTTCFSDAWVAGAALGNIQEHAKAQWIAELPEAT